MALAIVEARRTARDNRARNEELHQQHADLEKRCTDEELRQHVVRARVHDAMLAPFVAALSRLADVRLADLVDLDMPGVAKIRSVDVVSDLVLNLRTALAVGGGAAAGVGAGAGVGAMSYAVVRTHALTSHGIPIASLNGAAAKSASLAFLGGGATASGGAGMLTGAVLLGGAVTIPGLAVGAGVMTWRGRRDLRKHHATADDLDAAYLEFGREQDRVDAVLARAEHVRSVLYCLLDASGQSLPAFERAIDDRPDTTAWDEAHRACAAAMTSLAVTATVLMRVPLADEAGVAADQDGGALADAHRWLQTYHNGDH